MLETWKTMILAFLFRPIGYILKMYVRTTTFKLHRKKSENFAGFQAAPSLFQRRSSLGENDDVQLREWQIGPRCGLERLFNLIVTVVHILFTNLLSEFGSTFGCLYQAWVRPASTGVHYQARTA